eukprot:EC793191.1.p3 GENE.EC793191.1~~EC793191.1.p3  ORF type:complete len:83 (+),score=12.04 EC793191.1:290-538(+)
MPGSSTSNRSVLHADRTRHCDTLLVVFFLQNNRHRLQQHVCECVRERERKMFVLKLVPAGLFSSLPILLLLLLPLSTSRLSP